MNLTEYKSELIKIKKDAEDKSKKLLIKYCQANNPYKIGDIFTDHIGSILIENIKYDSGSLGIYKPCCVYYGSILKKDKTPKKNGDKRYAWQTNEVK